MPGIRFDLYSDEKKLLGELKREFPDVWGEANALFAKMSELQDIYPKLFMSRIKFPPENFIEKHKLKKFTRKITSLEETNSKSLTKLLGTVSTNKNFMKLFEGVVRAVTDLDQNKYSMPYLSQVVNTARFEGYEFEDGLKSFHEILMRKVKDRGGIVLDKGEIKEISTSGRYIDALKLKGHSLDKIVLSYLVVNGNPKSLLSLLPSRKNFVIKKKFKKLKPKYLKYTFYLKLKDAGYPVGMRNRVIVIADPEKELSEENFLYMHKVNKEKDEKGENQITLAISTLMNPDEISKSLYVEQMAEKVKKNLSTIIPFMDEHFIGIDTPKLKPSEEIENDLRSSYVFESDSNPYFGITGLPYTSYFKNLYLIGQTIYPGLGFDGEIQSGLKVSRVISDTFKVKRP